MDKRKKKTSEKQTNKQTNKRTNKKLVISQQCDLVGQLIHWRTKPIKQKYIILVSKSISRGSACNPA